MKVLLPSPYQNHVPDILNENRVNDSFLRPRRFTVDIEVLNTVMKRPELGFWSKVLRIWERLVDYLQRSFRAEGMSIFMFILRWHWETTEYRTDESISNFRHKLRRMIKLGLDVNVHATSIYS